MNTTIDWQRELDEAIGHGRDRSVEEYAGAGRRALVRRRRVGIAGLAAAAVLAGVGLTALGAGADSDAADSQVATGSDEPAGPAPMADSVDDVREAEPGEVEDFEAPASSRTPTLAVVAKSDGELVHAPGWTVEELEVLAESKERRVWGLSLSPDDDGTDQWVLLTWRPGSMGAVWDPPNKRYSEFDDWLQRVWAENQGTDVPEATLVDGRVEPAPGTRILQTVMHPEEAAAYGPVDEQAAVKLVNPDGDVLYALVSADDATLVDPRVLAEDSMAGFLAHLAAQADGGEGLR